MDPRVSALRQLVVQAPAPVVADALGFHQKSSARQVVKRRRRLEPLHARRPRLDKPSPGWTIITLWR
jgi:hypothetical protein